LLASTGAAKPNSRDVRPSREARAKPPARSQNAASTAGPTMTEIFVTCPECGLRVKVTPDRDEPHQPRSKCNHRQNPLNCPKLTPALTTGRQAVQRMGEARK
jgi:hypothetical protein